MSPPAWKSLTLLSCGIAALLSLSGLAGHAGLAGAAPIRIHTALPRHVVRALDPELTRALGSPITWMTSPTPPALSEQLAQVDVLLRVETRWLSELTEKGLLHGPPRLVAERTYGVVSSSPTPPSSWRALVERRFRKQVVLGDPAESAEIQRVMASLSDRLRINWTHRAIKNGAWFVRTPEGSLSLLANGMGSVAIAPLDIVRASHRIHRTAPARIQVLELSEGNLSVPYWGAVPRSTPAPGQAVRVLDWLTSEEAQRIWRRLEWTPNSAPSES